MTNSKKDSTQGTFKVEYYKATRLNHTQTLPLIFETINLNYSKERFIVLSDTPMDKDASTKKFKGLTITFSGDRDKGRWEVDNIRLNVCESEIAPYLDGDKKYEQRNSLLYTDIGYCENLYKEVSNL